MLESHVTHVLESLFNKVADLRWLLLNLTYKVALRQYPGLMKTKKKKRSLSNFEYIFISLCPGSTLKSAQRPFELKSYPLRYILQVEGMGVILSKMDKKLTRKQMVGMGPNNTIVNNLLDFKKGYFQKGVLLRATFTHKNCHE